MITPGGKNPSIALIAERAPGRAWLVGGLLRDALLKRPLSDVDAVVEGDARPLADSFAKAHGRRSFALDEERGTYRVVLADGAVFDFARLQGGSLQADLFRRDFTVNALALDPSRWGRAGWEKDLVDPTGGLRDLRARRLRMPSAAAFKEDPLRILRGYRFSAELGFSLTPESRRAAARHRRLLARPAPERVREELLGLLASPRAAATLSAMDDAGILTVLFPEVEPMRRTGRDYYGKGGVLAHSIAAVESFERLLEELPFLFPKFHRPLARYLEEPVGGRPRSAHLKLVELFHDVGKPATMTREGKQLHFYGHDAEGARIVRRIAERLRFSSAESRSLSRQVGAHMRPGNLGHQPALTDRAIFRFYRDLEEDAVALLLVSLGDHFTYLSPRARRARKDPVFLAVRRMLSTYFLKREAVEPPKIVDGHALMKALKMKPGPEVGRLLSAIREAQSAGEVKSKEEALALAKKLLPC